MDVLHKLEATIISAKKLKEDGVPSASIALLEDGKISAHVITTGSEDAETLYQACSISKAFAGLGVAKLVDEGKISFDSRIIDHLPQSSLDCLFDAKTAHLLQHVTVGMLQSHTSGISQWNFPGYVGHTPTTEDVLAGRYPSNTPRIHFTTFPGRRHQYAGGGYVVLQILMETITGKAMPQLMQELVFQPLGMSRSRFGALPVDEKNLAKAFSTGFTPSEPGYHRFIEHAAAGLWATPTDMLKGAAAILDSLYTDSGFLTQQTARKILTQVVDFDNPMVNPLGLGMGLSWMVNECAFSHSGDNRPGYCCDLFVFHGGAVNCAERSEKNASLSGKGFAIMTNGALGHEVAVNQLKSAIFYLKGWPRYKTLSARFGSESWVPYAAAQETAVSSRWKEWVGKWTNGWQIVDEDGGPAIAYRSFPAMKLRAAAMPVAELSAGKEEIMCVVDGLPIGVRLTWHGHERVVELRERSGENTLKQK